MAIEYEIDSGAGLVRIRVAGTFSTSEMTTVVEQVATDSRRPEPFAILADHRQVAMPVTSAQIDTMLARIERHRAVFGGTRWAVVTNRPASFGMMRLLAARLERIPMEMSIFADPAAAEAWLAEERQATSESP